MHVFVTVIISSLAISYWAELTRSSGWLKHAIIFLGSLATVTFYPVSWFLIPIVFSTAFLATTWIHVVNAITSKPQVIPRRL